MDDEAIHDLIGTIYEAPLDPRQWQNVVKCLKTATKSHFGHLWCGNIHDTLDELFSSRDRYLAIEHDRLSFPEMANIGSSVQASSLTDPHLLRQSLVPEGKAVLGCQLVPPEEFKSSQYFITSLPASLDLPRFSTC